MKVFFDTNVLVAAFAARGLCADLFELVLVRHQLVCGVNVLRELDKALVGKIKLPANQSKDIVRYVTEQAVAVVSGARAVNADVDMDDAVVLGEALAGGADVFVTGDAKVLALTAIEQMPIKTPRQFWAFAQAERR